MLLKCIENYNWWIDVDIRYMIFNVTTIEVRHLWMNTEKGKNLFYLFNINMIICWWTDRSPQVLRVRCLRTNVNPPSLIRDSWLMPSCSETREKKPSSSLRLYLRTQTQLPVCFRLTHRWMFCLHLLLHLHSSHTEASYWGYCRNLTEGRMPLFSSRALLTRGNMSRSFVTLLALCDQLWLSHWTWLPMKPDPVVRFSLKWKK